MHRLPHASMSYSSLKWIIFKGGGEEIASLALLERLSSREQFDVGACSVASMKWFKYDFPEQPSDRTKL